MRTSEAIKRDLDEFSDLAKEAQVLLLTDLTNPSLKHLVRQNQQQVERLRMELVEMLRNENRHRVQVILSNFKKYQAVPIDVLAGILGSVSGIVKEVSRSILGNGDSDVSLAFETDFPSSFGMLLSTTVPDYELIGANNSVFDRVFTILKGLESQNDTKETVNKYLVDRSIVNKFKALVRIGSENSLDLRISWGDLLEEPYRDVTISNGQFRYLRSFFREFEKSESVVTYDGVLVGLSLVRNKLELLIDSGTVIVSNIDEEHLQLVKSKVGQRQRVVFREVRKFKEDSEIAFQYYTVIAVQELEAGLTSS